MEEKRVLRKTMKDNLAKIEQDRYEVWSEKVRNRLFSLAEWKNSEVIGITLSREREVNTYQIIEQAWTEGKKIAVPKCDPMEKKMTFRELQSFDQLEVVYSGLKEPIEEFTNPVVQSEIDLLIVPGLSYTKNGYRLGFGGGYYDRYLKNYANASISLAFDVQIIQYLPIESFDIPVQRIITNESVIDCRE